MIARLLLDLAGAGFLLIVLFFVTLLVYGTASSWRHGRKRRAAATGGPAWQDASILTAVR